MEDISHNSPEPLGIGFTMRAFVDSDHAGDSITRRSRTGFIIFLNSAPIYWYSKKLFLTFVTMDGTNGSITEIRKINRCLDVS